MIDYAQYERAQGLNWYAVDPDLQFLVDYHLDAPDRDWVETHLQRMGALCGGPIAERSEIVDKNPPRLERYDRWGEEINEVVHHPAALATKRDLWEQGFLGLPWSREVKERGRPAPPVLLQAFQYLLCQADTGMLCSVGMTTAAAELIERYAPPEVRERFLPHMTTMNYDDAMDGSMFMTEKLGGSDLGAATKTTARQTADGWRVDGEKWFCSNVDGGAIMLLARPEGSPAGVRGLSLFLVPKRCRDGSLNGIHIRRIKDKLGTRSVPTAEVELRDAEAYLLAGSSNVPDGRGLNRMMEMVNTSRIGVAIMGLGILRRSFLESAIYTARREAFGKRLRDQPMVGGDGVRSRGRRAWRDGAALQAHPGAAGQVPGHAPGSRSSVTGSRAARRQRLHRELAGGAPAARRAVPHDLGRCGERRLSRRAARDGEGAGARGFVRARRVSAAAEP